MVPELPESQDPHAVSPPDSLVSPSGEKGSSDGMSLKGPKIHSFNCGGSHHPCSCGTVCVVGRGEGSGM